MQPGRRSAAALSVLPLGGSRSRPKLTPIGSLTKNERRAFDHTARQNPHLAPADIPMLELYSMAYCRAVAAKRKGPQVWEREARVVMALGTKLRLTPQATTEPRTAARRRAEQAFSYERKPWDRAKMTTRANHGTGYPAKALRKLRAGSNPGTG